MSDTPTTSNDPTFDRDTVVARLSGNTITELRDYADALTPPIDLSALPSRARKSVVVEVIADALQARANGQPDPTVTVDNGVVESDNEPIGVGMFDVDTLPDGPEVVGDPSRPALTRGELRARTRVLNDLFPVRYRWIGDRLELHNYVIVDYTDDQVHEVTNDWLYLIASMRDAIEQVFPVQGTYEPAAEFIEYPLILVAQWDDDDVPPLTLGIPLMPGVVIDWDEDGNIAWALEPALFTAGLIGERPVERVDERPPAPTPEPDVVADEPSEPEFFNPPSITSANDLHTSLRINGLETTVRLVIGAASMCWSNDPLPDDEHADQSTDSRVFDSTRALAIGNAFVKALTAWQEHGARSKLPRGVDLDA